MPKTLLVAGVLSVVCSAFVSTSAVKLRPLQEANKAEYKKKNILIAAGLYDESKAVDELFKKFDVKIVDLETGKYKEGIDPAKFDQRKAAKSKDQGVLIPSEKDKAGIKRRSKYVPVYFAKDAKGQVNQVILPVNGKGLWSTLYGYLALDRKDLSTINGFVIYEHGETPGLGGEVDNLKWKKQWIGKKAFDKDGKVKITVIKGRVDPKAPGHEYQIDGLSGATITSRGVTSLLNYWLGADGYEPFLKQLKSGADKKGK